MNDVGNFNRILAKAGTVLKKNAPLSRDNFRLTFGVEVNVCSIVMEEKEEEIKKVEHLLWTLYYLKKYPTVRDMERVTGVSVTTFYNVFFCVLGAVGSLYHDYVSFFVQDVFSVWNLFFSPCLTTLLKYFFYLDQIFQPPTKKPCTTQKSL